MPKSSRFAPKTIQVAAATTVTWRNEDDFTHGVEVEGRDDGKLEPGKAVTIRFPKAGRHDCVCMLHPHDMRGLVIVQ